jgi:putative nucleotidyltransferase with HDIG domain
LRKTGSLFGLSKVYQKITSVILDWRHMWYPLFLGVMVIGLGFVVAVLINPSSSPSIPISQGDIGKVAKSDIRAPIRFTVPDIEETERKRREAEDRVKSVYDFDTDLGSRQIQRLREAFAEMDQVIAVHNQTAKGNERETENSGVTGSGWTKNPQSSVSKTTGPHAGGRAEAASKNAEMHHSLLDAKLDEHKVQFLTILRVILSDEDFAFLREDRFSSTSLNAVTSMVNQTMQGMIVSRREQLGADLIKGINVRYMHGGGAENEQQLSSSSQIMDLEQARLYVEQIATQEPIDKPAGLRLALIHLAKSLVTPNVICNWIEIERRKKEAGKSIHTLETPIEKGTKIIRYGDRIEPWHVRVFQQMAELSEVSNALERALGTVLLIALIVVVIGVFSAKNIRKFRSQPKDLVLMMLILFVFVVSVKIWFWIFGAVWEQFRLFPLESYYYAIPFATGAMLIRFVLNSEMALAFTALASALAGLLMENSIGFTLYCLGSSLVAAGAVGQANVRSSVLKAGLFTGLINMALAAGLSLFGREFLSVDTLFNAIFAFSGGMLAAIIVTGVAPLVEVLFGYTTDIKLLELANLNHPLLKDLIVQAPGSYHHSIIVGSLVEAAAESIRCNPLLARVMAYYHDIGKVKNPAYFSENQRDGNNRHDKLKPSLSATVIKSHVKDGAELGRAAKLGQPIVDAIMQHHGTSLIKYFYQKAKDQEEPETVVAEEDFRYPGPKPQTREVALVMLADSVEAAAKSITDPSPARLQGLVQNIINRIFVDGQLDACDLTLKDLHEIARAFNRVLNAIYHYRPDYPESATKERDAAKAKFNDGRTTSPKRELGERHKEVQEDEDRDRTLEDLKRLGM